jgi:hypothetical protein
MRFMLLLKGDPPEGSSPDERLLGAMLKYNEDLVKADGPFTESKELIAGYLLIQVRSKEEAIEWASRCPVEYAAKPGQEAVVEVRQVAEMTELPTATDEQRAREQRIREQAGGN